MCRAAAKGARSEPKPSEEHWKSPRSDIPPRVPRARRARIVATDRALGAGRRFAEGESRRRGWSGGGRAGPRGFARGASDLRRIEQSEPPPSHTREPARGECHRRWPDPARERATGPPAEEPGARRGRVHLRHARWRPSGLDAVPPRIVQHVGCGPLIGSVALEPVERSLRLQNCGTPFSKPLKPTPDPIKGPQPNTYRIAFRTSRTVRSTCRW